MSEENKPIISNRDKLLSVSVFPHTETDENGNTRTTYGLSVQRAYQTKEQKGTKNYERQKIAMFPDEALRMAELLRRTYSDLLLFVQMNKPQSNGNNYPTQTMDVDDVPPMLTDEIPF